MVHDYQTVSAQVIALIAEQLHKKPEEIGHDATLESLGADSLDRVELIMKLEEAFHIEVSADDAEQLTSVRQAIEYIVSKLNK